MDLTILTSLDLMFYIIFGLAVLAGFMRGMKKTLYSFITMLIFYAVFFFTINQVIDMIWTMNLSFLDGTISGIMPELSGFTSFQDSIGNIGQVFLGDTFDLSTASPEVLALLVGVTQFALKLVYTLLYFTVILLVYKLITAIIYAIFSGKRDKNKSKNRGFGAIFGALNGALAVFVLLITLGGFMNVTENVVSLVEATDGLGNTTTVTFTPRNELYQAEQTIIPLANSSVPTDLSSTITLLQGMVDNYNNNFFVQIANQITVTDIDGTSQIPLHLSLFDSVLSFKIGDENIALRYELSVYTEAALVFLESDYANTGVISDVTGDEIRSMFEILSHSVLIPTLLPVAIEVGAQMQDVTLGVSTAELYQIDYASELSTLADVAGTLFDILNGAGFISGEGNVGQIAVDGDMVRGVFGDLSDSSLVTLLVSSLLVPMIENSEGDLSLIITVPDDIDWSNEITALGEVFAEVVDSGATINDVTEGDPAVLLNTLSAINVNTILSSELITTALINVLSQPEILSIDFLVIPDNVTWRDTYDGLGNLVSEGELRHILVAIQSLSGVLADFDLTNLGLDFVSGLTDDVINDLFDSQVLVATVSDLLLSGSLPLDIPDSVLDSNGYITKTEITNLSLAVKLIVQTTDGTTDLDITKLFNLSDTDIDTLLSSEIINVTIGKMVSEMAGDPLVVPSTVLANISVNQGTMVDVVTKDEIKAVILSLQALGITSFDNLAFDASILSSLEVVPAAAEPTLDDNLINQLLGSEIVHATVSKMVLDLSSGASSVLSVPAEDASNQPIVYTSGGVDLLSKTEIGSVLKALYRIGIDNFESINFEDTSLFLDNKDILLDSAIIHATISGMILDVASSSVVIPSEDVLSNPVIIAYSDVTYIDKTELSHFFDALSLLGITDPTAFSSGLDLSVLATDANQNTFLSSAIMHATVSKTLFDLGSGVLVVPAFKEDGTTPIKVVTGPVSSETTFVVKDEIKALLNAFIAMGFTNLESFGTSISSTLLFDYREEMLLSSSLQATISNQLLNVSSGTLLIPDKDSASTPLRIVLTDVEYVTLDEINAIIDALELLGLTDLATFDLSPATIFAVDFNELLASATMQATVSDYLLTSALDESAPAGSGSLIIPSVFRETYDINGLVANGTWVEKTELINLLTSLNALNITDFSGSMDASIVTDMDDAQLNVLLASASMHITIDNMLKGNNNISASIPDLAYTTAYTINNVVTKDEIKAFIIASNTLSSSSDFTNVNFDVTAITSLSAGDRDIVLNSMIVRNILTDQLETTMTADDPFDLYWPADTLYMNNDNTTFLTKDGINEVLTHYGLI